MGDHRPDVALEQPGGELVAARENVAVRELEQHQAVAVGVPEQRQRFLFGKRDDFRADAHLGRVADLESDPSGIEFGAKLRRRRADAGKRVVVAVRKDVRRDDRFYDSGRYGAPGQRDRCVERPGPSSMPGKRWQWTSIMTGVLILLVLP